MFKKFLIIFCLFLLTGCSAPGTAFLGPIFTGAKTGSVYHGGVSYASNKFVKEKFGEDPLSIAKKILTQDSKKNNLIIPIKSKKIPNRKLSLDFKSTQSQHKDFLIAVKKMLK